MNWTAINNWILHNEIMIRSFFFIGVLVGLIFWEIKVTWRKSLLKRENRWSTHLILGGLSVFLVKLTFPIFELGMAAIAQYHQIGLFHTSPSISIPFWLVVIFSIVGMDFAMYMQHRWMHRYPLFWRVHQVHHTDIELDATTGLRFHPIEYFFMMGVKLLAVLFLGAPLVAVFIYEILLTSLTLFIHSNIQLSLFTEHYLRWFLVTPGMHRIHHSDIPFEHNRNFGFCFSIWDRLFKSYLATPHQGEYHLILGLEHNRQASSQTIQRLLALPFLRHKPTKNRSNPLR